MPEQTLSDFLDLYTPEVQDLVMQTRARIFETLPELTEMVDPPSKIIAYGYSPKYADLVCAIMPYKTYVNLIFGKGTLLPDPLKILTGTGKRARHIKFTHVDEIQTPAVQALLLAAAELTRPK